MRRTLAAVVLGCLALSPAPHAAKAGAAVTLADVYAAAARDYPSAFAVLSFTPDGPQTVAAGSTLTVNVVAAQALVVSCSHAAAEIVVDGLPTAATSFGSAGHYGYIGVPDQKPDPGVGVLVSKGPHVLVFTIPATVQSAGQLGEVGAGAPQFDYTGPWVTAGGAAFSSLLPFDIVGKNTVKFLRQPTSTKANATMNPVEVAVVDPKGNVVADDNSSTVAIAYFISNFPHIGGHGTYSAPVVNGVATFADLSFDWAHSGYQLIAHGIGLTHDGQTGLSEPGTSVVRSKKFSVGKSAWKLQFVDGPTNAAKGQTLAAPVTVEVVDATGAVVVTEPFVVTLKLSGRRGASLGGTSSVGTVNGVATFANLSVNETGAYQLVATDLSMKPVKSKKFKIAD